MWYQVFCAACSATDFWLYVKHKKREEEAEIIHDKLMEGFEDEEETENPRKRKKIDKERRAEYNAFLQDLLFVAQDYRKVLQVQSEERTDGYS